MTLVMAVSGLSVSRRLLREIEAESLHGNLEASLEALAAQGLSPSDVIAPFDRAGYQTFVLDNDYDTWRYLYPGSARKPRPLQEPIQWDANLLFSRTDPRKV